MAKRLPVIAFVLALLGGCGPTVGDPCTTSQECGGGTCLNQTFVPGGYCSVGCKADGLCPTGSTCVREVSGRGNDMCLRTCRLDADCRQGYLCRSIRDSAFVCI